MTSKLIAEQTAVFDEQVVVDFFGETTPTAFAQECVDILSARGLPVTVQKLADVVGTSQTITAGLMPRIPSPAECGKLGSLVAAHATTGYPTVLFVPPNLDPTSNANEMAACVALLVSRGAIVTGDPEVWIECVILLASYGPPAGHRVAIVAPPGSWLAAATAGQQKRAERLGQRFTPVCSPPGTETTTDMILADTSVVAQANQLPTSLVLPVSGRPGFCAKKPVLLGICNSIRAAELCGHASLRIQAGDGRASSPLPPDQDNSIDEQRFTRQLNKLRDRAGDHECKVLLSSYGITITRQAVATTPSAATRLAQKAGYPIQIKAWGADQISEPDGGVVLRDINTASEVRRAFSSVCASSGCEAVIVRATPMTGRAIRVSIRDLGALGLVVLLHQDCHAAPAAALAPLRKIDAQTMARQVIASRIDDQDPDWDALCTLLVRASHLVADHTRVKSLELCRVVIGTVGEGAMVIDARAEFWPSGTE